jgi:hypothetical protein
VVVSAAWALVGQDEVVVESQRPEGVPFDLAAGLHLMFGAVVVACRKPCASPAWPHRRDRPPRGHTFVVNR